jgi:uncharacterized protein
VAVRFAPKQQHPRSPAVTASKRALVRHEREAACSRTAVIPSRYNFAVAVDDGVLLYNVNSGALMRLQGEDGLHLADWLAGRVDTLAGILSDDVTGSLVDGSFLVPEDRNELALVRERFWSARTNTPLVLTITTTQDCNLGCFYCYEERSTDHLDQGDVEAVVASARTRLIASGKRSLHVDWYGGEPLLNIEFLDRASSALQDLCRDCGVTYHASVISNGTLWPHWRRNLARLIAEHAGAQPRGDLVFTESDQFRA